MTNYNNSYHRTIKLTPSQVSSKNENEILNKVYRIIKKNPKYKFKIGDHVRISNVKRFFEKGYTSNWTEDVLKDQLNDAVNGVFYEPELQKVEISIEKEIYN